MSVRFPGALLAFSLAMVPTWAWATCERGPDGSQACVAEQIQLLYVTQSGAVYLMPTSSLAPATTGFSCEPVSGRYLLLNPAAPNFKALYAALLSARVVGAPVTMALDPTQPVCTIAYVTL
jgi:hypothetical protein